MHVNRLGARVGLGIFVACGVMAGTSHAAITDFTQWSQVQDPPNVNFTSSASTSQVALLAGNGAVPSATDIGYQSVNGATPATSTTGYAFDPASSFSVAIDFSLSFSNTPTGGLAIGFGIGEDSDGQDSAGAVMFTQNGSPQLFFGGAARINDVTQPAQLMLVGATLSGSLFATYDAASGDVTLGATPALSAVAPTDTTTFSGIQDQWDDTHLLTSFFLRSDDTLGSAWSGGNGQAVFSNFRVLSGSPLAVPEPASLGMLALATLSLGIRRRS